MLAEEVALLVRRKPFVPMRLHLADGTTFDFLEPHPTMVSRQWLRIATDVDPHSGVVDRSVDLWLANILRVEEFPEARQGA